MAVHAELITRSPDVCANGLYFGNEQVAAQCTLDARGLPFARLIAWTQDGLDRLARQLLAENADYETEE